MGDEVVVAVRCLEGGLGIATVVGGEALGVGDRRGGSGFEGVDEAFWIGRGLFSSLNNLCF